MHTAEGDAENPAGIIDSLFGFESVLSYDQFLSESEKPKNSWPYLDDDIRNKMKDTFGTQEKIDEF